MSANVLRFNALKLKPMSGSERRLSEQLAKLPECPCFSTAGRAEVVKVGMGRHGRRSRVCRISDQKRVVKKRFGRPCLNNTRHKLTSWSTTRKLEPAFSA